MTRTPPLKIIPLDNDGLSYQGSEKAPGMSLAEFMSGSWGYTLALSKECYHLAFAIPTPILHQCPFGNGLCYMERMAVRPGGGFDPQGFHGEG